MKKKKKMFALGRAVKRKRRRRRLCLTFPWRLASNEAAFPTQQGRAIPTPPIPEKKE
jgi:hypothetical protein